MRVISRGSGATGVLLCLGGLRLGNHHQVTSQVSCTYQLFVNSLKDNFSVDNNSSAFSVLPDDSHTIMIIGVHVLLVIVAISLYKVKKSSGLVLQY